MEVKFVKPKLSSSSKKEDVLWAINQIIAVKNEIKNLEEINERNYADFITEHRGIIKKIIPIVGKTYRYKGQKNGDIANETEFFYVNYVSLQSVPHWCDFMPKVKCIPLDVNGHPFSNNRGGYVCVDDYDKGQAIRIDELSEEDYPEITKVFKKAISKKTENELFEYERLKRKFG